MNVPNTLINADNIYGVVLDGAFYSRFGRPLKLFRNLVNIASTHTQRKRENEKVGFSDHTVSLKQRQINTIL